MAEYVPERLQHPALDVVEAVAGTEVLHRRLRATQVATWHGREQVNYVLAGGAPVLVHNSGGACKESVLPKFNSFEQARNKALDLLGEVDPATRQPFVGNLEAARSIYGKVVGFTNRVDGVFKRFRMDYDPVKGSHINVEIGRGERPRSGLFPGTVLRMTS